MEVKRSESVSADIAPVISRSQDQDDEQMAMDESEAHLLISVCKPHLHLRFGD